MTCIYEGENMEGGDQKIRVSTEWDGNCKLGRYPESVRLTRYIENLHYEKEKVNDA